MSCRRTNWSRTTVRKDKEREGRLKIEKVEVFILQEGGSGSSKMNLTLVKCLYDIFIPLCPFPVTLLTMGSDQEL
jgi:hypothetical protein